MSLIETKKTTTQLVEVPLPFFSKRIDSRFPDTWFYINGRRDLITIVHYPMSKKWEIDISPVDLHEFSLNSTFVKEAVQFEPIRPSEFWRVLDRALASLQETVYIDRGNLFK